MRWRVCWLWAWGVTAVGVLLQAGSQYGQSSGAWINLAVMAAAVTVAFLSLSFRRWSAVLVAELRAVALLLEGPDQPRPAELLLDSTIAIRYLRNWQRGRIERMPEGYSLLPRRGPQSAPTLVRLAGIMAQHPEIQLQHVHSHTGHPLNEAADALASLAQRGLPAVETRSRAEGLVEAFLRTWREQPDGG